ncbi:MAG: polysaccharide deacetylase family protein [Bacteroidota bacterium]
MALNLYPTKSQRKPRECVSDLCAFVGNTNTILLFVICRMFYFVKTPWWLKKIYPECVWQMPEGQKKIYLTFDDGPHPVATSFVLEQLKKYNAKATFFCIGKNVEEYPFLYEELLDEGHSVGNHTYNHLNGWKTADAVYLDNIILAKQRIDSTLFRPPYGRATKFQLRLLRQQGMQPIMWSVLSGDFDTQLSKEKCLQNVSGKIRDGSIVIFHDSAKAYERLEYVLPRVLEQFSVKGFQFEQITNSKLQNL